VCDIHNPINSLASKMAHRARTAVDPCGLQFCIVRHRFVTGATGGHPILCPSRTTTGTSPSREDEAFLHLLSIDGVFWGNSARVVTIL